MTETKVLASFRMIGIKLFPDTVHVSEEGSTHAFGKICKKGIKEVASGIFDLKVHFKTKMH